jgi:hypothetical protein
MKKIIRSPAQENLPQSANFVAILAIVTEIARRLNENISKVKLKPLDSTLIASSARQDAEGSKA